VNSSVLSRNGSHLIERDPLHQLGKVVQLSHWFAAQSGAIGLLNLYLKIFAVIPAALLLDFAKNQVPLPSVLG